MFYGATIHPSQHFNCYFEPSNHDVDCISIFAGEGYREGSYGGGMQWDHGQARDVSCALFGAGLTGLHTNKTTEHDSDTSKEDTKCTTFPNSDFTMTHNADTTHNPHLKD